MAKKAETTEKISFWEKLQETSLFKYVKAVGIIRVLADLTVLVIVGLFCQWLYSRRGCDIKHAVAPTLACLGMCWVVLRCAPVLENYWGLKPGEPGRDRTQRTYFSIFLFLALYAIIMITSIWNREGGNIGDALMRFAGGGQVDPYYSGGRICDATHYFNIARFGYVGSGDMQYEIVFYPLFPLLLHIGHMICDNYAIVALVLNLALVFGSCVIIYNLAGGQKTHSESARAVKYMMLFPLAFYLFTPMSEALFLFMSLAVFYFMEKRKYLFVFITALLAGLTRSLGLVTFVPIIIEAGRLLFKEKDKKAALKTALCAPAPFIALGIYMFINYKTFGNPKMFLEIQKNHWSQSISYFWNTAEYLTSYMFNDIKNGDLPRVMGFTGGGAFCLALALGLIIYGAKHLAPKYTAYSVAYYCMAFGATWLLSAPRYTMCLFPLALVMAKLTSNKYVDAFMTFIYALGLAVFTHYFIQGGWAIL